MEIRDITEEDLRATQTMINGVARSYIWPNYHPRGWNVERVKKEVYPANRSKNEMAKVIIKEKEIIGVVRGHDLTFFLDTEIPYLKEELFDPESFYLKNIIVALNYQGGIVGPRLLRLTEEHASSSGYTVLTTRTPPLNRKGRRFLEKSGFKLLFEHENPPRVYYRKTV